MFTGRLREFYERPHPRLSGFEFWELRVMWLLLRGECMRVPIYVEEHPVLAAARRDRLKTAHTGFQMGVPFNEAARRRMNTDPSAKGVLNRVIGDGELCAWQPVRGVVWVQTRNPRHARRLAKRSDARLVLRGVAGGFLKTFEFRRPLTWAGRLINRYLAAEVSANAALNRAICPA